MHHSGGASLARRLTLTAFAVLLAFSVVGCTRPPEPAERSADKPAAKTEVILSSTTSTQDSGLFDVLVPAFEEANPGYSLKVVAVGTGEALKLGETKDADVLLVHAKADEEAFVGNGFGVERRDVMYNDFIVVGPAADPAGMKRADSLAEAVSELEDAGEDGTASYISRGDESGTHKRELKLWTESGVKTPDPSEDTWYESTGQGMGETLKIASEKDAYTLTDRATYLSMKDTLDLVIVREGDPDLLNQYGVIVVAGSKNQEGGQAFFDWVLSEDAQAVIESFGLEEYGQPLFVPNASR